MSSSQPSTSPRFSQHLANSNLLQAMITGIIIFFFAWLGIVARPDELLSAFWPANAVFLGLLVRYRQLASIGGWVGAIAGYLLAGYLAADPWLRNIVLTLPNLMGVAAGYLVFSRLSLEEASLKDSDSMLHFMLGTSIASLAAGVGGWVADPILFTNSKVNGLLFWSVSELVNYMAILPVILTLPSFHIWLTRRKKQPNKLTLSKLLPLLFFIASLILGLFFGGPGAIPYPIPALLWCALSYSVFATSLLTLFFSAWTLLAISYGFLPLVANFSNHQEMASLRVGIMLTALGPLAVASVMSGRNYLLKRLEHTATHDPLTDALNRGGYIAHTKLQFLQAMGNPSSNALFMFDIDHFKAVNDNYGHAAGDRVLTLFVQIVQQCLREPDLLGRLGGEEFSILLMQCPTESAQEIAQRIIQKVATTPFEIDDQHPALKITVSIGVVCFSGEAPLDILLSHADQALYQAKTTGRNRFELVQLIR
jgi:diguanylate cyclase (GGDEF)-like protein